MKLKPKKIVLVIAFTFFNILASNLLAQQKTPPPKPEDMDLLVVLGFTLVMVALLIMTVLYCMNEASKGEYMKSSNKAPERFNPADPNCPHTTKIDIVVNANTTVEEIYEVCEQCNYVTKKRIEA